MRPHGISLLVPLSLVACGFRTPWQEQRSYADALKPAPVAPNAAAVSGSGRVFRVRAYADADYRAQTPRWDRHIAEQIDRASAVLAAQFGIRLELESAKAWTRGGASAHLEPVAEQLVALDDGKGVDWVVGFVSSLDVFSAAQDQLGVAGLFGRHMVLRAMSSAAELDALNAALKLLSASDREQLARDRRLHKETAIFLHEWAHTLGAIHDRMPDSLMAPSYDPSQSSFSEASARLVGIGLESRDAPASRDAWSGAYREELTRSALLFWDAAERTRALAIAEQVLGGGPARPRPPESLPADDAKRLDDAIRREKVGDVARALQLLQPLVERYPTSSQIQDLACEMLQESGASPAALLDRCARAAALPDVSGSILLVTAQLHLAAGNPSAALPVLARAESKVSEPSAWVWLGQLQLAAGAISAAERAAAHAPQREAAQLRAGCSRTRRFVGFPKAGVAGDREASYVSSALAAHQDIDHHRLPEALKRAAQLALSFPDAPAAAIIECRAKSRGTTLASIQMSCTAAANADSEAFLPRYILGLVAGARHRWGEAEVAMRRALELDETTQEVWASLAAVQRSMRATAALRALEARYKARFGATLTPALFPEGWAAR